MSEVIFQPIGKRVPVKQGDTLLEASQAAGVALSAVCGGMGVCGDCRVRVLRGAISSPNATEMDLLSSDEIESGLRLACQTVIEADDDITVDVPLTSLSAPQRSQVEGEEHHLEVMPAIHVHDLTALPPSVDDLRGDWERLQGITPSAWRVASPVLAALPSILREHDWRARMVSRDQDVICFLPPDTIPLGFAVDIGTTGLAAYLVDLLTGDTLAIAGATNPQIAYGEDVMARLTLTMRDSSGADRLQKTIVSGLNDLLHDVCNQAGCSPSQVVDIVAVGNTAMHHLLLGLPVEQLGTAPYVPVTSSALYTPAQSLGLDVAPGANLYLPPNVAGFVGGDHVSMLLATDTADQPGVTLSLDIGTNTEITLNAHGRMWCCSTASGPAFEGAHIKYGMRAADGAIERLMWQDGRLLWRTINHAPPVGLCGSGILDSVAALRTAHIVTPIGAIKRDYPGVQGEGHDMCYEIVSAVQSGNNNAITVSRSDINEVQLAKAAIRAGIKLLTEQAGLSEQDIDRVIIAGAFGNYVDLENAIIIGLFPPLPLERFVQVGNAAGIGAKRLLMNSNQRALAETLVQRLEYVELTNHPDFTDRFSQAVVLDSDLWN
jgi:uncharacterized 2Fe-2S/4Fe-4S cluster protein (DUF4445 family)